MIKYFVFATQDNNSYWHNQINPLDIYAPFAYNYGR